LYGGDVEIRFYIDGNQKGAVTFTGDPENVEPIGKALNALGYEVSIVKLEHSTATKYLKSYS